MPKLKFTDLKTKKPFETDDYKIVSKSGKNFAVAISPSGKESYRIVSKDFPKK